MGSCLKASENTWAVTKLFSSFGMAGMIWFGEFAIITESAQVNTQQAFLSQTC